jgi:hypothetical protein
MALRNPVESLNYFDFNLQVLDWRLYAYLLRHQSELKKYSDVEEVNPSRQGSEDTHLHAVLPVSISQAEQVRLAYSLQKKLGRVHRRVAASRCGGVNDSRAAAARILIRPLIYNSKRSLTTEEGAYEHGEATNRPRPPIEPSKVLERPSSHLRLHNSNISAQILAHVKSFCPIQQASIDSAPQSVSQTVWQTV